ncbi:MAG: DinB family protein [Pyrinomonadaceae bacterium]
MRYQTISEIYETNDRVRARLNVTLAALTAEQATARPDDEKWSIAQVAEHVSMVGHGMSRICAKLLSKAEESGELSDGRIDISAFADRAEAIADVRLEAPEIVQPTGARSIAESVEALEGSRKSLLDLRPMFEKYDSSANKFPHPYLGDMTAVEWLALYGAHEGRHLKQIKRILAKLA